MTFLQNSIKPIILIIATILTLTFIITILNYFDIISYKVVTIAKTIIPLLAVFSSGIIIGAKADSKGWLSGLKLSGVFLFLLILFNILALKTAFTLNLFIYYISLILATVLGSMIGISRKKID